MPTERELKYSTTDEHVPSLAELTAALEGTGMTVSSPTVERYQDVYFDTADGALMTAGAALRKRHRPGRSYATYKGPVTLEDGLHSREELEEPLTEEGYWPPAVLATLPEDVSAERLEPHAELDVRRVAAVVSVDGEEVADLAFDAVESRLPGEVDASATFYEVEIEALTDDMRADAHLRRLADVVGTLVPLTPSSFSKLDRSLALLSMFEPGG